MNLGIGLRLRSQGGARRQKLSSEEQSPEGTDKVCGSTNINSNNDTRPIVSADYSDQRDRPIESRGFAGQCRNTVTVFQTLDQMKFNTSPGGQTVQNYARERSP